MLGLDSSPIPESERLFSAQGTHFQTLQMKLDDSDAIKRIVEYSEERFWKQGFDFLITFDESEATRNLRREVGSKIPESGGGVVLEVLDGEQLVAQQLKDIKDLVRDGPRTNIVLTKAFAFPGQTDSQEVLALPQGAIPEVEECFTRFSELTSEQIDTAKVNRALGDLLLYLVSSLGEGLSGAAVTANGKWKRC